MRGGERGREGERGGERGGKRGREREGDDRVRVGRDGMGESVSGSE